MGPPCLPVHGLLHPRSIGRGGTLHGLRPIGLSRHARFHAQVVLADRGNLAVDGGLAQLFFERRGDSGSPGLHLLLSHGRFLLSRPAGSSPRGGPCPGRLCGHGGVCGGNPDRILCGGTPGMGGMYAGGLRIEQDSGDTAACGRECRSHEPKQSLVAKYCVAISTTILYICSYTSRIKTYWEYCIFA